MEKRFSSGVDDIGNGTRRLLDLYLLHRQGEAASVAKQATHDGHPDHTPFGVSARSSSRGATGTAKGGVLSARATSGSTASSARSSGSCRSNPHAHEKTCTPKYSSALTASDHGSHPASSGKRDSRGCPAGDARSEHEQSRYPHSGWGCIVPVFAFPSGACGTVERQLESTALGRRAAGSHRCVPVPSVSGRNDIRCPHCYLFRAEGVGRFSQVGGHEVFSLHAAATGVSERLYRSARTVSRAPFYGAHSVEGSQCRHAGMGSAQPPANANALRSM